MPTVPVHVRIRRGAGFTLIEIMVAVLVLALGLIGASVMQLSALRSRHQSALLSNAVHLAAGMAERMRANSGQLGRADADNPYLNLHYSADVDGAAPAAPSSSCYGAADCGSDLLAAFDIADLKRQLNLLLPGGRVAICRDTRSWNAATRSLDWRCDGGAADPIVIKIGWHSARRDGELASGADRPPVTDSPGVALGIAGAWP